ncbi:Uncharacterised protein [Mycobacterium tuberculosis]|nr:Uncharacterised protein [Mycobacterium tuberculosis]
MKHFTAVTSLRTRYSAFHLCCYGVLTFRIGKDMQIRNIHFVQEIIGIDKIFTCLTWKTYNYVHSNTTIRH